MSVHQRERCDLCGSRECGCVLGRPPENGSTERPVLGRCNCPRQLVPPYTPSTYDVSPERCNEHGDPSLPACSNCGGKGSVYGENRDDPPWWPCVPCGGTGVARNA